MNRRSPRYPLGLLAAFGTAALSLGGCSFDTASLQFVPDAQLNAGGASAAGRGGHGGAGAGGKGGAGVGGKGGAPGGNGGAPGGNGGTGMNAIGMGGGLGELKCLNCLASQCKPAEKACAGDPDCKGCVKDPMMACALNSAYQTLAQCQCMVCSSECKITKCEAAGSGGSSGVVGMGGTDATGGGAQGGTSPTGTGGNDTTGGGGAGGAMGMCTVTNQMLGCCDSADTVHFCDSSNNEVTADCSTSGGCHWDGFNYSCGPGTNSDPTGVVPRDCSTGGGGSGGSVSNGGMGASAGDTSSGGAGGAGAAGGTGATGGTGGTDGAGGSGGATSSGGMSGAAGDTSSGGAGGGMIPGLKPACSQCVQSSKCSALLDACYAAETQIACDDCLGDRTTCLFMQGDKDLVGCACSMCNADCNGTPTCP